VDLGIKGRRAIVCASSKGLGRACAIALANEGVHVTITARGAEALAKTAAEIRAINPGAPSPRSPATSPRRPGAKPC